MKYLFRLFCAIVIYPIYIICTGLIYIICNIGIFIWYFDFNNFVWFDNYYFYIRRNEYCNSELAYEEYYKSPYHMIIGKLTSDIKIKYK